MKISVIIPAYNEEKRLAVCLQSIKEQIERPDEVIVIDNNSTDNTAEIAKAFGFKVVEEKKQGLIQARNRGFDRAVGEVIARTDADTIVPPDWIKKIKKHFEKNPQLVGLSGRAYYYGIPLLKKFPYWPTKNFLQASKKIFHHDFLFGPNMAITKNSWEKVKDSVCLFDHEVHEDIDLAIHLAEIGKIKFDAKLRVNSSPRRGKKPKSYFEYPYKYLLMLHTHQKLIHLPSRKKLTQNFHPRKFLKKSISLLHM